MSVKHNLEQWIAQLDYDDTCDITDRQVSDLIRNYAALEARCAALAAENAGLRDINAWCKTDAFKNMYREFKTAESLGCPDVDCMHDAMLTAIMHAPETPATDAFLAEVRAQGVEMFAESQKEYVRKNRSELDSMTRAAYCGSAVDAERFAAQLRKGVI